MAGEDGSPVLQVLHDPQELIRSIHGKRPSINPSSNNYPSFRISSNGPWKLLSECFERESERTPNTWDPEVTPHQTYAITAIHQGAHHHVHHGLALGSPTTTQVTTKNTLLDAASEFGPLQMGVSFDVGSTWRSLVFTHAGGEKRDPFAVE